MDARELQYRTELNKAKIKLAKTPIEIASIIIECAKDAVEYAKELKREKEIFKFEEGGIFDKDCELHSRREPILNAKKSEEAKKAFDDVSKKMNENHEKYLSEIRESQESENVIAKLYFLQECNSLSSKNDFYENYNLINKIPKEHFKTFTNLLKLGGNIQSSIEALKSLVEL